ncbi:ribosome silencing factor [Rickettsiales endosymbiont of Stachyamoeba lipophora]|uniref:ribosome silencing factor n=1 Tax=Rickettsiales endosymbiont of Stachyamoeba lipophora TaxID=2486578 RepID=UPI000F64E2BA|nr:ribosome silencing factor [Rickettsiales endosymbiont of Stachyamoeba lipophora]AZL16423.1 ribosome silencing factor [Rickettsiales endosymbiont of Stachyamoeba lipophora]
MNKDYSIKLKDEILSLLDNEKAEDIACIDLAGKTEIADFMIVASGLNKRHVATLGDKVGIHFKDNYEKLPTIEGLASSEWVLVDLFDVIVHIFQPHVREYYKLEQLWNIPLVREEQ